MYQRKQPVNDWVPTNLQQQLLQTKKSSTTSAAVLYPRKSLTERQSQNATIMQQLHQRRHKRRRQHQVDTFAGAKRTTTTTSGGSSVPRRGGEEEEIHLSELNNAATVPYRLPERHVRVSYGNGEGMVRNIVHSNRERGHDGPSSAGTDHSGFEGSRLGESRSSQGLPRGARVDGGQQRMG